MVRVSGSEIWMFFSPGVAFVLVVVVAVVANMKVLDNFFFRCKKGEGLVSRGNND